MYGLAGCIGNSGKNRLEARLGSWEPDHEREPTIGRGAGEATQREYEAARANAAEARKNALAALRERHRAHAAELQQFYARRMRDALALGKGPSRRASVAMIIAQRKAAHQERIARQRLERQAVLDAHRGVNWREWRDAQRKQEQKQAREREEEKKQEQKNEQEQTRQDTQTAERRTRARIGAINKELRASPRALQRSIFPLAFGQFHRETKYFFPLATPLLRANSIGFMLKPLYLRRSRDVRNVEQSHHHWQPRP